jgi:hypothetical protein
MLFLVKQNDCEIESGIDSDSSGGDHGSSDSHSASKKEAESKEDRLSEIEENDPHSASFTQTLKMSNECDDEDDEEEIVDHDMLNAMRMKKDQEAAANDADADTESQSTSESSESSDNNGKLIVL